MNYIIISSGIITVVFFSVTIKLLFNIRSLLVEIYHQINMLEAHFQHIRFPEAEKLNLEMFTARLKKIVRGFRSIKPNNA